MCPVWCVCVKVSVKVRVSFIVCVCVKVSVKVHVSCIVCVCKGEGKGTCVLYSVCVKVRVKVRVSCMCKGEGKGTCVLYICIDLETGEELDPKTPHSTGWNHVHTAT